MTPKLFSISLCVLGLAFLLFLFAPIASAQEDPIVPCGIKSFIGFEEGKLCTVCHIFALFDRLLKYLFIIMASVAALFFAYGGMLMIFPAFAGSPQLHQRGQRVLTNAVLGIFLILVAWLAVDTVLKAFGAYMVSSSTNPNWGPWNQIQCEAPEIPYPEPLADAPPPPRTPIPESCTASALSAKYGTSNTIKNAPELDSLINCMEERLFNRGIITRPIGNSCSSSSGPLGSVCTTDQEFPLCNYTRGNTSDSCTPRCSHSRDSCHYGGSTGSTGARAVDFGDERLYRDIREAALSCAVTSNHVINEGNHIHVSTMTCDKN